MYNEVGHRMYNVSQKCTNFETVQHKIKRIDFDDIWQKYSKDSRIGFASLFSCRFSFLSNFCAA